MLLTEFHGQAEQVVDADPAVVFGAITSVDLLPEWNKQLVGIIHSPGATLYEGVEWVVQMSAPPGAKWSSRSRVLRLDGDSGVFEYVSQSDDGNPSFVLWRWAITRVVDGTRVDVSWRVYPKTFWRRLLFARLRRRQLGTEVPASLNALAYRLAPSDTSR